MEFKEIVAFCEIALGLQKVGQNSRNYKEHPYLNFKKYINILEAHSFY